MASSNRAVIYKVAASFVVTVLALVTYLILTNRHHEDGSGVEPGASSTQPQSPVTASEDPAWLQQRKTMLEQAVKSFVPAYYSVSRQHDTQNVEVYVTDRFMETMAVDQLSPQAQAYIDQNWRIDARLMVKQLHAELVEDATVADVHAVVRLRTTDDLGTVRATNDLDVELLVQYVEGHWLVDTLS